MKASMKRIVALVATLLVLAAGPSALAAFNCKTTDGIGWNE